MLLNYSGLFKLLKTSTLISLAIFLFTSNANAIVVKEKHNDWAIHCEGSEGDDAKRCAFVSFLQLEKNPNIKLNIVFIKQDDNKAIFRVVTPIGIYLPPGVQIKIDNEDAGKVPIATCSSNVVQKQLIANCISQALVNEKFIDKFRKGGEASFIIAINQKQGIVMPVSLKGFTKGFDNLEVSLPPKQAAQAPAPKSDDVVIEAK